MNDQNNKVVYEYAFVDAGTSSRRDEDKAEIMYNIIKKGKVSNIFLTHPDWDHISYLLWVKNYQSWRSIVGNEDGNEDGDGGGPKTGENDPFR